MVSCPQSERLQMRRVIFDDNLEVLRSLDTESVPLIYIDPPFNTGKQQTRKTLKRRRTKTVTGLGSRGRRFKTRLLGESSYLDEFKTT